MSLFNSIGQIVHAYQEMRNLSRTERMIRALPPELRKDIGWPDAWTAQTGRHPTGSTPRSAR